MKHKSYQTNSELSIARSLAEARDFKPNWRQLCADQLLTKLKKPIATDGSSSEELKRILDPNTGERDEGVRQLLRYHFGLPFDGKAALEWAHRCRKDKQSALAIKAMVVAGYSVEEIAQEMTTSADNIKAFEKLYFDVRPYIKDRIWLQKVCSEHRWLQVAFQRGYAGVEEVIFRRCPKGGDGKLHPAIVLAGRVSDGIFNLEASNIPVSEDDVRQLTGVSQLLERYPNLFDIPDPISDLRLRNLEEKYPLPFRRRVTAAYKVIQSASERKKAQEVRPDEQEELSSSASGTEQAPAPPTDPVQSRAGNS